MPFSKSQVLMALLIVLYILLSVFFSSCSPVKRVLRDPQKFEQVANEVVKRGYCVNDTIVETVVKDTTIITYVPITREIYLDPVPFKLDTLLSGGIHLVIHGDKLKLTTPVEQKEIIKTVYKTQTVRDTKLESILQKELAAAATSSTIDKQRIAQLELDRKDLLKKYGQQKTLFGVVLLLLIMLGIRTIPSLLLKP